MLGRYVGGTLLILGGAMLLAPEAQDEAARDGATVAGRAAAPEASPVTGLSPADDTVRATPDAGETEVVTRAATRPVDLDGAVARASRALPEGGPQAQDATAPQLSPTPQPSLDDLVTQARLEGSAPSLSNPTSLGAMAVSAETQALIARVEAAAPEAVATPARTEDILYVTGARVNLRAGPSTGNPVIGTVVYGEAVELLDYANDSWAQIRADGEVAFMSRRFLSPEPGDG